jgi:uncharacterized membrane protein (UPF0127 family)
MRLTRSPKGIVRVVGQDGATVVCERCRLANSPWTRLRGLMGKAGMERGQGLVLEPTFAIHTGFMRFPIDAVFLDREHRVVGVREGLVPWRAAMVRGARSVLELASGEASRTGVTVGDRLSIREEAQDGG